MPILSSGQPGSLIIPRDEVRKVLTEKLEELKGLQEPPITTESELEKAIGVKRKIKDYISEYLERAFNVDSYKKEFTRAMGSPLLARNLDERIENFYTELPPKITKIESILDRLELIPEINKEPEIRTSNLISVSPSIGAANASLSAISNMKSSLDNISNIYSNFGAATVQNMQLVDLQPLISNIQNIQQIAGTTMWKEIADTAVYSPTIATVQSIQDLTIPSIGSYAPEAIIPQKIVKEINSTKKIKADRIYNYPAYKYIFNLEVFLRDFINKYIIEPNKNQLSTKISQATLDDWEDKKNQEEKNLHIDHITYDLIEYSDFTHLKDILDKKSSITILKNVISEANIKTITSKLYELEPIRIKVAHSRALTEDEFNTLKVYSDKIKKIIPKESDDS